MFCVKCGKKLEPHIQKWWDPYDKKPPLSPNVPKCGKCSHVHFNNIFFLQKLKKIGEIV